MKSSTVALTREQVSVQSSVVELMANHKTQRVMTKTLHIKAKWSMPWGGEGYGGVTIDGDATFFG